MIDINKVSNQTRSKVIKKLMRINSFSQRVCKKDGSYSLCKVIAP